MTFRQFALFTSLIAAAGVAHATDQQRQGFILGLGLGYHNTEISSGGPTYSGVGTSFMIGGGITNQLLLYYLNDVAFLSIDNRYGNSDLWAAGQTGIGMTYYFSPQAPSVFLGGGVGLASLVDLSDSEVSSYTGSGYSVAVGYEFAPHFSVEFNLMNASLENNDYSQDTPDTMVQRVIFKWMLY